MKKTIRDVKVGDLVMGTDGQWHKVIEKTKCKISYNMYEVIFSNGSVKCDNLHQWNIFVKNRCYLIDTEGLYQDLDWYKGKHIGTQNGPVLIDVKKIDPEIVQCITTDAEDHQFAIYTTNLEEKED